MVKISAFQALRPTEKLVEKVPTQAYSNYSKDNIKKEINKNKYSFLNIITTNPNLSIEKKFNNIKSVSYTHLPSPRDRTRSRMPSSA